MRHRSLLSPLLALLCTCLLAACADGGAAAGKPAVIPPNAESIVLGMGCFWGAEKRMSALPGVVDVESGYANGSGKADYESVLAHERALRSGATTAPNHAEVVKVTFDPSRVSLERVLAQFWENHDPTQGNRQGNDIGSNYRSAIYTQGAAQLAAAQKTRAIYQRALASQGYDAITTDIAPLTGYRAAEDYHQDYLVKNPNGYCGLGGTGVRFPGDADDASAMAAVVPGSERLDGARLDFARQLVVFESEDCPYCRQFKTDVLDHWTSPVKVARSMNPNEPTGWTLQKALFATPTIVLFQDGKEVSRYTGYNGEKERFWKWLGYQLLTPEQQKIAFEQGTERAFTGSNLDEKRPGTFVDPISGAALFRSDSKFDSGTGWPSFFTPLEGSVTLHEDRSEGMRRVEVRSASSGIHLGHVFDDGPPPTYKRYCINGNVLKFVPDA
jgi:peptide methionine sulfoxide reductase msrA/msrB